MTGGVFAAGELTKARGLGLDRDGTLAMYHFISRNVYAERTRCAAGCECAFTAPGAIQRDNARRRGKRRA